MEEEFKTLAGTIGDETSLLLRWLLKSLVNLRASAEPPIRHASLRRPTSQFVAVNYIIVDSINYIIIYI